jgi:RimJ/RimL family protein N-acetyltransferase
MCVIEDSPVIQTGRLLLRQPAKADIERVAAFCVDHDVARMTTRMPSPYTRAHAEDFVARCGTQDRSRDNTFAIELADEGLIGVVGLFTNPDGPVEMGYWIGRPYWGQGYATEAARGALDWARSAWRKRYVTAGHFADNEASGRVLVKAGFLYTGVVENKSSIARGEPAATRMMVWLA